MEIIKQYRICVKKIINHQHFDPAIISTRERQGIS